MIDAGVARAAQIVDVYELADHRAEFLTHEYPVRELGEVVQQIANQPGTRVYREDAGGWPVRLTIVRDKLVPDISSMGHENPVPPRQSSAFDGIRLSYPNMSAAATAAARAYYGKFNFSPFNPGPIN